MLNYIDIHSHLTEKRFDGARDGIIQEMREQGVGTISIGVDRVESHAAVNLAKIHDHMWATIGQHPVDNKTEVFDAKWYQDLYDQNKEKIVAVGECGLDYYWPSKDVGAGKLEHEALAEEKERQKQLFTTQIDFAVANDLPLMLHVRSFKNGDAHADALEILDAKQAEHDGKVRANFHFFTETPEIAERIVRRGWCISFPGVITFADLDETVRAVPLDQLMIETDSPYAAPVPHRGELATPLMVPHIAQKISDIKGISVTEVESTCLGNAQKFFGISF